MWVTETPKTSSETAVESAEMQTRKAEEACLAQLHCVSSQTHSVKSDARSMDAVVPQPYNLNTDICLFTAAAEQSWHWGN